MVARSSAGRLTVGGRKILISGLLAGSVACTGGDKGKASLPPANPAVESGAAPAGAEAPKASPNPEGQATPPAAPAGGTATAPSASGSQANAQPASGSPVSATAPAANEAVDYRLTGEVNAPRRSQIAFRVNGFIESVVARPGTIARKGDVLASLDNRDFVLRLELAKARRDQAKVGLEAAQREYQREVQLKNENASTATVFDKVKAAFDQARLAVKLAELDVETAELALKDTRLVAPYDCVVAVQMKHDSENVQSGTPVFEIYDTAEPEISLDVPERLLGQLALGTRLKVTVPSAGYTGAAEIIRMVPVIAERTRTFQVTARLANADRKIVPGLYAEATLN